MTQHLRAFFRIPRKVNADVRFLGVLGKTLGRERTAEIQFERRTSGLLIGNGNPFPFFDPAGGKAADNGAVLFLGIVRNLLDDLGEFERVVDGIMFPVHPCVVIGHKMGVGVILVVVNELIERAWIAPQKPGRGRRLGHDRAVTSVDALAEMVGGTGQRSPANDEWILDR